MVVSMFRTLRPWEWALVKPCSTGDQIRNADQTMPGDFPGSFSDAAGLQRHHPVILGGIWTVLENVSDEH